MKQMNNSQKRMLKLLLTILTLLSGPISYLCYSWVISHYPDYALALLSSRKQISGLVAGFAFAMLGFLAAIITILFAFVHSETFKAYKRVGYLDVFFFVYKLTIICLIFTAGLSLVGFARTDFVWPFRFMLMSFVVNLSQVTLITISITNLARNADHEPSD